jgi:DNA-binding NarL/FixJ family response regulator
MIRLFLLDDHEIVRRGLKELFEATGENVVVGEAGSAHDALATFPADGVDVAVLDVRLPDGNGIDVCRELISLHPGLPCLMLTSFADDEALDAAVLAGAKGYLLKDIHGTDLLASVAKVARGESLIPASQVEHVRARLQRRALEDARLASLSDQEHRIFDLLAEGLSNREIADEMFLAEKTVKNYVSNMLAKLGYERRTEAALDAQRRLERDKRGF